MFVITSEIETKLSFGEFSLTVPQNSVVSIQDNNIHIKEKEEVVPCVPILKEDDDIGRFDKKVEDFFYEKTIFSKLKSKENDDKECEYKENDDEECEYREFESDIKTSGLTVQEILGSAHHQSCQYTNRHKKYNTVRLDAETIEKERNMADAGEVVFPLPVNVSEEPKLNEVD
jgi:hypothetical protein